MADLVYIPVKFPREMAIQIDKLRAVLQARNPEKVVTRSDAVRHCVESLTASMTLSSLTDISLDTDLNDIPVSNNSDRDEDEA